MDTNPVRVHHCSRGWHVLQPSLGGAGDHGVVAVEPTQKKREVGNNDEQNHGIGNHVPMHLQAFSTSCNALLRWLAPCACAA